MGGVQVLQGGVVLGETRDDGTVSFVTERPEGETIGLSIGCPQGYRARPQQVSRTLRVLEPLDTEAGPPPLSIDVACDQEVRDVVVVVDTERSGLAVAVDGRVVGRTNEAGFAHVLLRGPAGRRALVSIDTSELPGLVPSNPTRNYTLVEDDVLHWHRPFESEDDSVHRRRRRRQPRSDLPERIQ